MWLCFKLRVGFPRQLVLLRIATTLWGSLKCVACLVFRDTTFYFGVIYLSSRIFITWTLNKKLNKKEKYWTLNEWSVNIWILCWRLLCKNYLWERSVTLSISHLASSLHNSSTLLPFYPHYHQLIILNGLLKMWVKNQCCQMFSSDPGEF